MHGIIDFHSHILPRINDGSSSLEESVAMLQMELQQQVSHVVATPHFYAHLDRPEHFLEKRAVAESCLREAMATMEVPPRLSVGAEVSFFRGISESDLLWKLTIDGKRCILLEMPHAVWTDAMYRELEAIHTRQGLIPIIAHMDRYIGRFRTFGIPDRLSELPVLVQVNASFFCESRTAKQAVRLLKKGQIHLLGSGCHSVRGRTPNLGEAIKVIRSQLGESALEYIRENQKVFLSNND